MSDQTSSSLLVVGRYVIVLNEASDDSNYFVIHWRTDGTALCVYDVVASSCVESDDHIAILVSADRELGLIPVVEWIVHAVGWLFHDGFHVLHLADPLQTVLHLVPLVFELLLIGNLLHGASTASFRLVTHWLHTVWRWCDELHQSSVGYVLLHLDDLHLRQIAHHGILDKYSHALNVSNALSVIAHILDEHLIILIFDKCDFTSICRIRSGCSNN